MKRLYIQNWNLGRKAQGRREKKEKLFVYVEEEGRRPKSAAARKGKKAGIPKKDNRRQKTAKITC